MKAGNEACKFNKLSAFLIYVYLQLLLINISTKSKLGPVLIANTLLRHFSIYWKKRCISPSNNGNYFQINEKKKNPRSSLVKCITGKTEIESYYDESISSFYIELFMTKSLSKALVSIIGWSKVGYSLL